MKSLFTTFLFATVFFNSNAQCEKEPFVLVNLFTTQGCYACPLADDHLEYFSEHSAIIENSLFIAHHVTSFDGVLAPSPGCSEGSPSRWTDIYSSSECDVTWSEYSNANSWSTGTPQFIIQGKDATGHNIGKDGQAVGNSILNRQAEVPEVGVCLSNPVFDNTANTVKFDYDVIDAKKDGSERLSFVLLEDNLNNIEITSGENCGKTLDHSRVRRELKSIVLNSESDGMGTITMNYGNDVVDENIRVGAFVQKVSSKICIGGTKGFNYSEVVSVEELSVEKKMTLVYPNPSEGIVNFTASSIIESVKIYSLTGKLVFTQENINNDQIQFDASTNGISEGIYMYEINLANDKGSEQGRLVLQ